MSAISLGNMRTSLLLCRRAWNWLTTACRSILIDSRFIVDLHALTRLLHCAHAGALNLAQPLTSITGIKTMYEKESLAPAHVAFAVCRFVCADVRGVHPLR